MSQDKYLLPSLQFNTAYLHAKLSYADRREAASEARSIISRKNSCFVHLVDVNVITIPHDNYANTQINKVVVRCRHDYVSMIYHEYCVPVSDTTDEHMFCFMASDKFEPVVTVVCVDASGGKLNDLTYQHLAQLNVAVEAFKRHFGIQGETYAYTCKQARQESVLHSGHFHLRIRIPTDMYIKYFPALQVLGRTRACIDPVIQEWEPLAYNFRTQSFSPWPIVSHAMHSDSYNHETRGLCESERRQLVGLKDSMDFD